MAFVFLMIISSIVDYYFDSEIYFEDNLYINAIQFSTVLI